MSGLPSLIGIFVFFIGVLCVALIPLWRGADSLQRRILIAVLVATPVLAYISYAKLGAYEDLQIRDEYQRMIELAAQGQQIPPNEWDALLEQITLRAEQSDKAEYWYLLAGIYEDMQDYELASNSYEQAAETYSDDAGVLSRWAETEFLAQGYNLTPKVQELAERVLAIDPGNATVLGLLGISAFQSGGVEVAISFWTRALEALPPNSDNAQVLRASIALAQQELTEAGGVAGTAVDGAAAEVAESGGIPLSISLGQGVDVAPSTTLFVIARIPGSPMPTAVTRLTAADLPAQIRLDDSTAMIPGTNLLNMPVLEIVARLSFSGQPAAQSGDYEVIQSGVIPSELDGPIELILSEQIQ